MPGLRGGEQLGVALAQYLSSRKPDHRLSGTVEAHIAQRVCILDKDHAGNVLEYLVEKSVEAMQLLIGAAALGNVEQRRAAHDISSVGVAHQRSTERDRQNAAVAAQQLVLHVVCHALLLERGEVAHEAGAIVRRQQIVELLSVDYVL